AAEMQKKGVALVFDDTIEQVDRTDAKFAVRLKSGAAHDADLVMFATGRRPNTADLGLEQAGVQLDAGGAVMVNDDLQTTVPHIYAIGDVTDRMNLTPVATAEGTALAHTLFGRDPRRVDYQDIPTCVFSQPNLASVGLGEDHARE